MLEGYLNVQPARIFFPDSNNLRITDVYERFSRGSKHRLALSLVISIQDGCSGSQRPRWEPGLGSSASS